MYCNFQVAFRPRSPQVIMIQYYGMKVFCLGCWPGAVLGELEARMPKLPYQYLSTAN